MSRHLIIIASIFSLGWNLASAFGQAPPHEWIEPSGHRVIRLSGDQGGSSLYFHENTYTPKGDKLIIDTRAGIAAIDLTKLGAEPIKPELVVPEARAISVAWRTPDVYYRKAGTLCATNLETKATRELTTARG